MHVLAVVSEIFPLIKTGGLADVAGALPGALAAEGVAVRSLVPGYPPVLRALEGGVAVARIETCSAARHASSRRRQRGWTCSPSTHRICMRGRAIRIAAPDGHEWADNAFRFAALSRARAAAGARAGGGISARCGARA